MAPAPNNEPPAAAQQSHDPGAGFFCALPAYGNQPSPIYVPARVWPISGKKVPPIRKGPIYTLPEDIILYICKLGVDSLNLQKRVDFIVLFSHVCRTWRDVTLSCSSLWTDITIAPRNVYTNVAPALAHGSVIRAQEFALRSRIFPLSVRLELPMTLPRTVIHTPMIMDWLYQVLPRVKYLSMSCDTLQAAWAIMARLQPARMEALEAYEIKFGDTALSLWPAIPAPPHHRFLFLTGQNCSKLTHVKVSGLPVDWSQWSLARLTSLSINFMSLRDRPSMYTLKHILTMNRDTLEKFEIQGGIQPSRMLPMIDALSTTLPRLTHLTIGYLSQWEPCIFINEFLAPALKHLKLSDKSLSILIEHWPQSFPRPFDLDDPILRTCIGLQPFNYFSSTILLENLVDKWTPLLENLKTLELEHFQVLPMFTDVFLQRNPDLSHFEARVILAHRMLQSCLQLRRLILTDSSLYFLHALNRYPEGTNVDDTDERIPAPALTHLYISTWIPDDLRSFLKRRAEILDIGTKGPHIWDRLELATNTEDLGDPVRDIGLDRNDLSRIAKSTVVSGWEEGFDIDI